MGLVVMRPGSYGNCNTLNILGKDCSFYYFTIKTLFFYHEMSNVTREQAI